MTYQIEDRFLYEGDEYTLVAKTGDAPFSPSDLGIRTNMASTGCWRGFLNYFGLVDGRLVLAKHGFVSVEDEVDWVRIPGPAINGVDPVEDAPGWPEDFNNYYLDLNLPLDYDGGLVIGKDVLSEHVTDMDWITIWWYRRVLDLRFSAGVLIEARDLSALMAPIQEYADQQSASWRARTEEAREATREIEDRQERKAAFEKMYRETLDPRFEQDTDEKAKEVLTGLVDEAYLKMGSDPS